VSNSVQPLLVASISPTFDRLSKKWPNELEGFLEGIQEVFPKSDSDLVALRQTGVRLFREGSYPPLRGTYFSIEDDQHFLFTMGYLPYLETYPGSYVPEPWQITEHYGSSAPKDLLKEVLVLTKMNVNNCAFADGTPITLSFSQKIGEIMKHISAAANDPVVEAFAKASVQIEVKTPTGPQPDIATLIPMSNPRLMRDEGPPTIEETSLTLCASAPCLSPHDRPSWCRRDEYT
jgi:hypothetical protein